jgi:hypothetical protein
MQCHVMDSLQTLKLRCFHLKIIILIQVKLLTETLALKEKFCVGESVIQK